MINTIKGNLLDLDDGFIVHGCNSYGVFGAGIAKQIDMKWPHVIKDYTESLSALKMSDKDPLGTYSISTIKPKLYVINMITQASVGHSGRHVNYSAIGYGFRSLFNKLKISGYYPSINFPLIGAGLGGGDWKIIEQIIQDSDQDDKFVKNLWIL